MSRDRFHNARFVQGRELEIHVSDNQYCHDAIMRYPV